MHFNLPHCNLLCLHLAYITENNFGQQFDDEKQSILNKVKKKKKTNSSQEGEMLAAK